MGSLYQAFGLTFDSEIVLGELSPAPETSPDVEIRLGAVPDALPSPLARGVRYQCSPGLFHLHVDNIATFLVENGTRITIAQSKGATEAEIRLFLLGSVFGALLQQRGMLTLHGSAVAHGGKAICFLGQSGVGKSTLAVALAKEGFPVVTDDICCISTGFDGALMLHPGYPQSKLWRDSLELLAISPDNLPRVRPQLEKRALACREDFQCASLPIEELFILVPWNKGIIDFEPTRRLAKLTHIRTNTYRDQFVDGLGARANHFTIAAAIAATVPVTVVKRPKLPANLAALVTAIKNRIAR